MKIKVRYNSHFDFHQAHIHLGDTGPAVVSGFTAFSEREAIQGIRDFLRVHGAHRIAYLERSAECIREAMRVLEIE